MIPAVLRCYRWDRETDDAISAPSISVRDQRDELSSTIVALLTASPLLSQLII